MLQPRKTISLYRDQNILFILMCYIYRIFFICFGLDFGFFTFKSLKAKILSFIWAPSLFIYIMRGVMLKNLYFASLLSTIFYISNISQILGTVLSLKYIKTEKTVYHFIQDLRVIDFGLKAHHSTYNMELKLLIFFFVYTLYRFSITIVLYSFLFNLSYIGTFANVVPVITIDIVRITYGFMFYLINCRLNRLGEHLKAENSGFLTVQYLYKSVVDIADHHSDTFEPVFAMAILFSVPKAMAAVFLMVQLIKTHRMEALTSCSFYLSLAAAIELLMQVILPAICAGMLNTEANKIKTILHDLLLLPRGQREAHVIHRFIRYVESRGCQFRVYKVLPLDADLIGMVLGFCATYLIVIIQFTETPLSPVT